MEKPFVFNEEITGIFRRETENRAIDIMDRLRSE